MKTRKFKKILTFTIRMIPTFFAKMFYHIPWILQNLSFSSRSLSAFSVIAFSLIMSKVTLKTSKNPKRHSYFLQSFLAIKCILVSSSNKIIFIKCHPRHAHDLLHFILSKILITNISIKICNTIFNITIKQVNSIKRAYITVYLQVVLII